MSAQSKAASKGDGKSDKGGKTGGKKKGKGKGKDADKGKGKERPEGKSEIVGDIEWKMGISYAKMKHPGGILPLPNHHTPTYTPLTEKQSQPMFQ